MVKPISEEAPIKHYESHWYDYFPALGIVPHVIRTWQYMGGIRQGEYRLPPNAEQESLRRLIITGSHAAFAGIFLAVADKYDLIDKVREGIKIAYELW